MYLRAHGEITHTINETLPDLKELLVDAIGQPIRRISRFMQLALIGAGRCAREQRLPSDTAIYMASGRGDFELTVDVMNHAFRDGQTPKPLSFVNTVSNSASFYVAKCLRLESCSTFVSSRYFAFEDALQLALVDFQLGAVNSALIGAVDNAVLPLDVHRQRLDLDDLTLLAEGSHWLWVTRAADAETNADSQLRVLDVHSASNRDQLLQWIDAQRLDKVTTSLSAGQYLSASDFAAIQSASSIKHTFDYRQSRGYYASQSAAAIAAFACAAEQSRALLHINSDSLGRFSAMLVGK